VAENLLIREIEVLLFTTEEPLSVEEIFAFYQKSEFNKYSEEAIQEAIDNLIAKYNSDEFSFSVIFSGGGYQFLSDTSFHTLIAEFLNRNTVKRLSTAAIETLSIIAYKQPVTKADIEQIRGVNSEYSIQKLMERNLVDIQGRSDQVGKPLLYATTPNFLDYLGINSLSDLPKLKDFDHAESQIGENI
jgi:segregation and condensation protein B